MRSQDGAAAKPTKTELTSALRDFILFRRTGEIFIIKFAEACSLYSFLFAKLYMKAKPKINSIQCASSLKLFP